MTTRKHGDDLRGLGKLAVDATKNVTDVVQAMHGAIGGPFARLFSAPVYASIRAITSLVGGSVDFALGHLGPLLGEGAPAKERELLRAALNGVIGDYLAETNNPLAIEMRVHRVDETAPKPRIVVFVHGSSMNRQAWEAARELDATPLHVDYNSGLHISTNGRALSAELDALVRSWPVAVESIALVGHSMGGLVARSACHYARVANQGWLRHLRALVFLGTPHHGAPLERGGNWLETLLGVTPYSAPLAKLARLRSAGVTDLRFGYLIDEHWQGRDRFALGRDARTPVPLPDGVACCTVAAEDDGLVPVASALGEHADPSLRLDFAPDRRVVVKSCGHIGMLRSPEVWDHVGRWLHAALTRR
jgi:pimeloyl-ACP methyl ester carboxylesterase